MQKLKLAVLDKMISRHLTGAEVNFILYISHYQDASGSVLGVYYKDLCEAIGISHETFYAVMRSLEKKELIEVEKNYYGDWDIRIRDNSFLSPEANREGYVSTGHDIFHDKEFLALKAGEKLLAMYVLKVAGAGYGKYHIGVENFYEKFSALFGVGRRALQNYMARLKKYFTIGIKDKFYWITPLKKVYKSQTPTDMKLFSGHLIELACRRNRIREIGREEFRDTAELIRQYAPGREQEIAGSFLQALKKSVQKANEHIRSPYLWERVLRPKFIHKLLQGEFRACTD